MKTTYILGAGASANAIPVSNKLKDKIPELIFELEKHKIRVPIASEHLIKKYYQLINDLEGHSSVDEMLIAWIKGNVKDEHDLADLKRLISYLILYCSWSKSVDYRYDIFLRSLLKNSKKFPEDISILTWNYDLQLEFALCKYAELNMQKAQESMQCLPRIGQLPEQFDNYNSDIFSLIKLNGTAGLFYRNVNVVEAHINEYQEFISGNILEKINCWNYKSLSGNLIHNLLTHTPETSDFRRRYIDCSKKIAANTETLVVVGYSFPSYNNVVDREVLGAMKNLKKIIIQDLHPNCIHEKLLILIPNQQVLVKYKNPDYFYISSNCETIAR